MSAGQWFWIVYVICFLFGGFWCGFWPDNRRWAWPGVIVFILLGLLGWGIFGPPIR